ncbi:MAG: hypothetical protein IJQ73_17930 [Kiritimatiellae bacterium]|nr:hypothetical protein [Kiritimatiellia bacterium]
MKHVAFAFVLFTSLVLAGPPVRTTPHFGRVTASNTVEYAPAVISLGNIVDGRAYPHAVWTAHGTTNQYAALGWLPIDSTPPVRPGYVAEASGAWTVTNGVVAPVWVWRALPPRNLQLSKMKLKKAFKSLRVWDQVWEIISSDEDVLADWNDSVVLDEQDVMVQSAFRSLKDFGILTADQVEAVITNSVTEIEVRQ